MARLVPKVLIKPDPSPGNIIGNLETGDTYQVIDSQPYGPNQLIYMFSYTKKLDMGYLMAVSWSSLYRTEFLAGKEWQWLAMSESDLPSDWQKQWEKEMEEYLANKHNKPKDTEQASSDMVAEGGGYGTGYGQYCRHEYVKYVGLNEVFDYCKHCNKKREEIENG